MHQRDPIAERSKTLGSGGQSDRVAVEPDDAEAGVRSQQRRTVPSATERGVDENAARDWGEKRHDFIAHHRDVFE